MKQQGKRADAAEQYREALQLEPKRKEARDAPRKTREVSVAAGRWLTRVKFRMAITQNTSAFWRETWSLAMQALRANKMRAMLTMLGVIIGSGSIVLVVTVALGGQRYVLSQIEGIGANLVSARVVSSGDAGSLTIEDQITPADLDAVKQGLPQLVSEAAGTNMIPMTVVVNGQERLVNLVGVTRGIQSHPQSRDPARALFRFGRHGVAKQGVSAYGGSRAPDVSVRRSAGQGHPRRRAAVHGDRCFQ